MTPGSSPLLLPPPPLRPDQPPIARAALFLDFDGTLVEIAERPDAVRVPPSLPSLLDHLARGLDGALAVVSGRPLQDLDFFLPSSIAKAGDHGASVRPDPTAEPEVPDLPKPPRTWRDRALPLVEKHPGTLIEDKAHGFVIHFRQAPEAEAEARALMAELVAEAPEAFTLLEARMAWELRPRGPSKASAVRRLMARPPFTGRVPVFIGDDVTDEEGMEAARAFGGLGFRLQDAFGTPAALRAWLEEACHPWRPPTAATPAGGDGGRRKGAA
jgi:trehalose 6-phosphate phosphatase